MGSIIKKRIKNNIYYYYVESKRINGKPKYVNQKYLGSAENLLKRLSYIDEPLQNRVLHSEVSEFGAVTILYDIASRLGIVELIDNTVPKRKQGVSIGKYILTAAINRAVEPASTNGLQKWYSDTCLPMVTGVQPNAFTPQNFWNNTCIPEKNIQEIEDRILRVMISKYQIDTTHIIYDATNFFTYIDTMQDCETAKRGHSKEKRNDLRIISLSLMVSPDCNIPLLHETYPGNRPDSKEFRIMMEQLKKRYESITGQQSDITVIFDRGNNSEENIKFLQEDDFKIHYVGGLTKSQATELYDIPLEEYTPLETDALKGQSVYRAELDVFGRHVTAVIVHNPELEAGQMQGILINREKTTVKLLDLQQRILRRAKGETTKGKSPTVESVTKSIKAILTTEYMEDIFDYVIFENNGHVFLTFASSDEALEQLRRQQLGKTVLFTDRSDFTNEKIVCAYRSAWHVEAAFKQMKNTDHLTVRPIFHWTDEKIRVHIFICVLAYRLCSLLIKELNGKGIYTNINRMLDGAAEIKRVDTFFGDINKPEKVRSFTNGSELAQQIEAIYQLKIKYC